MRHTIYALRDNGEQEEVATYVNDNPAKEALIDYCVAYLFMMPGQVLNPRYRENATAYMWRGKNMWHLQWNNGVYSVRM